jgi:hypothetical protein
VKRNRGYLEAEGRDKEYQRKRKRHVTGKPVFGYVGGYALDIGSARKPVYKRNAV